MKHVTSTMVTYDASIGRVMPGQTYFVEDDKAERWISAGIATEAMQPGPPAPPAPDPQPIPPAPAPPSAPEEDDEEEDEDKGEEGEEKDAEELGAAAHKLHDEGLSERGIAQQLGVSRTRVHALLQR